MWALEVPAWVVVFLVLMTCSDRTRLNVQLAELTNCGHEIKRTKYRIEPREKKDNGVVCILGF